MSAWYKRKAGGRKTTCRIFLRKTKASEFLLRLLSRGRGDRTPVNGFGDRRTTAVLFPYPCRAVSNASPTKAIIPRFTAVCKRFFQIFRTAIFRNGSGFRKAPAAGSPDRLRSGLPLGLHFLFFPRFPFLFYPCFPVIGYFSFSGLLHAYLLTREDEFLREELRIECF